MNKGTKCLGAVIATALLVGCNATQQENLINSAAGAAVGAGIGMAVSSEKDKEEGALVGAGTGAIIAGLLTEANRPDSNSQGIASSTATIDQAGSVTDAYGGDPMDEILTVFDRALQESLNSGKAKNWSHLDFSGTIYPGAVREQFGRMCRPYRSAWRSAEGSGTDALLACRGANGKWETAGS
ncbi:MAG: hypothetical protein OXI87_03920 [Albidovulum sp.]|nr:hypothetical protein [Albidovulum sp.]MDE0529964.1 hypothetical protein [Albidovulum sp.]